MTKTRSKRPEGWRNKKPDDPQRHALSAKGIPNAPPTRSEVARRRNAQIIEKVIGGANRKDVAAEFGLSVSRIGEILKDDVNAIRDFLSGAEAEPAPPEERITAAAPTERPVSTLKRKGRKILSSVVCPWDTWPFKHRDAAIRHMEEQHGDYHSLRTRREYLELVKERGGSSALAKHMPRGVFLSEETLRKWKRKGLA